LNIFNNAANTVSNKKNNISSNSLIQDTGSILIVDDEVDILSVIRRQLQEYGFNTCCFTKPSIALEHYKTNSDAHQIIVSDLLMPKMNGFEFIRRIKQLKPNVKVAFITAFEISNNEFSTVLPSTKVDGFIQKPIAPSKLADEIRGILSNTKLKESVA
jgi:DNA-binding NtrC family response regulator